MVQSTHHIHKHTHTLTNTHRHTQTQADNIVAVHFGLLFRNANKNYIRGKKKDELKKNVYSQLIQPRAILSYPTENKKTLKRFKVSS